MGEGYTWETQNRERDKAVAQGAWVEVEKFLQDPTFGMVVLDELNIAIHHEYVSLDQVLKAVAQRPHMLHVVITGRGAKPELIDAADLVSEMKMIKHPFRKGIKAQKGVEF
jgi:cob(I)alamin adenosyltransferase